MSFWKQLPPNPTEDFRNFEPILESIPMAFATSSTSASVCSHNSEIEKPMELSRNWHWMWSTFYFHKKHYGYLTAMIKILPKLSSSLIKFIIFLITFQKYKSEIYKHRLSGIINSVLLKKSWYRPKL